MSSNSHGHEAASRTSAEHSSHQQSPEINLEQEILPELSPIAEIKQRQNVLTVPRRSNSSAPSGTALQHE
jgi:hypothetical protein